MASTSLEALFLRTRDQYAATGRRTHLTVLVLLLIHVALVTPWVERQLAQSSVEAEQQRFAELPEIATLDTALQEAAELARSSLEPALEGLAEDLQNDLADLEATVRRLAAVTAAAADPEDEEAAPPEIDPGKLPFAITDPDQLAAIRDAIADGGLDGSSSRYGLLAALDPVVEGQIARPRFLEINRAWKAEGLPEVENRLATAASTLPGSRLRFPEAKDEWGAFEGALSSLRDSVREFEVQPPAEPFWWASPETARELEIGLPLATAEKIRNPLAFDDLVTAAETGRFRYEDLVERLEQERQRALSASEAREVRNRSFATLLAEIGVDMETLAGLFPLLLGLVLATAMARRNHQLRELGMATRLTIEEGGSLALRDWCLAQLAGRLSDERTADEAWRGGWLRALGVLVAAFAWIAVAALQVRPLTGGDTRWLTVTLLGAAAVLAATIHRLAVARGLVRLFVAGESDTAGEPIAAVPAVGREEDEGTDSDADLDAHQLR